MLGKFEFCWLFHGLLILEKISAKNDNTRLGKKQYLKMERFLVIDEKQIQNILDDKSSKNTKKATEVSFNILCTYLKTRKIDFDFTNINKSD